MVKVCFLRDKGVQLFMWPMGETGKAKLLCGFVVNVWCFLKPLVNDSVSFPTYL